MSQLCQSNPAFLLLGCRSQHLWSAWLSVSAFCCDEVICGRAFVSTPEQHREQRGRLSRAHTLSSQFHCEWERESKREWELRYCCIKTMLPAKSIRFTLQYDIVFLYWLMFALNMFCSLILTIHPKICSVCLFVYLFVYLFIFGMCMMSVYNYCCTTCYFTIINLKKGTLF